MMRFSVTILLFLTMAAWSAAAAPAGGADARFSSGVTVRYENTVTDPDGIAFIRDIDRELTRLFRLPSGAGCEVVVRSGIGKISVMRRPDGTATIVLPAGFADHPDDPAVVGSLAARLTLARLRLADRGGAMPLWLAAGLTDVLRVNRHAARIVRNVRYFPLLRVLIDQGHTPDFRALMQVSGDGFSGSAAAAFGEMSRFLLEYLAGLDKGRQSTVGDYAAAILTGRSETEACDAAIRDILETPAGRRHLEIAMLRAAYNSRTPRPAASVLRHLPELLTITWHTLDAEGKPAGPPVKAPATELAALLADGHPEAVAIQRQLTITLRDFAVGVPEEIQPGMRRLIRTIELMDGEKPERAKRRLQECRLEVETAARSRQALEARLLAAEQERFPFAGLPAGWTEPDDGALSAAALERLLEAEKNYLSPGHLRR